MRFVVDSIIIIIFTIIILILLLLPDAVIRSIPTAESTK